MTFPPPLNLAPRRLEIAGIALEPIQEDHREGLRAAAAGGVDWSYMPLAIGGEAFDHWFDWSCKVHSDEIEIVYVVRDLTTSALRGSSRFLNIDRPHRRCEIGHTWYAPDAQGTTVNPAAKYLLLEEAFAHGAIRVELKTDALNARSRAAIRKLGATEEGIFRRHMVMPDGRLRDTVYFSIIAEEWPGLRQRIAGRLRH